MPDRHPIYIDSQECVGTYGQAQDPGGAPDVEDDPEPYDMPEPQVVLYTYVVKKVESDGDYRVMQLWKQISDERNSAHSVTRI